MAVITTTESKIFQTLKMGLDDLVGSAAPEALMPIIGTLEALESPQNTSGLTDINVELKPLFGKDYPQNSAGLPKVEVWWNKPQCDYTKSVGNPNICATGSANADPRAFQVVTLAERSWRQIFLTNAQFKNLEEDPASRQRDEIIRKVKQMIVEINNVLIGKMAALAGNYADGTASIGATQKNLPILNDSGAYFQPLALQKVVQDYKFNGYSGTPMLLGGAKMDNMIASDTFAGRGANSLGANYSAKMPLTMFTDYNLDGELANGKENAISWMPGTFRKMYWSEHTGYWVRDNDFEKCFRMNILGIEIDFDMIYVACDKAWTITLSHSYDLFSVLNDAYQGDDACWRNGYLLWELGCGPIDCNFLNTLNVTV